MVDGQNSTKTEIDETIITLCESNLASGSVVWSNQNNRVWKTLFLKVNFASVLEENWGMILYCFIEMCQWKTIAKGVLVDLLIRRLLL